MKLVKSMWIIACTAIQKGNDYIAENKLNEVKVTPEQNKSDKIKQYNYAISLLHDQILISGPKQSIVKKITKIVDDEMNSLIQVEYEKEVNQTGDSRPERTV